VTSKTLVKTKEIHQKKTKKKIAKELEKQKKLEIAEKSTKSVVKK